MTGREFELAEILTFIRDEGIQNVAFISSDVHYGAVYFYNPDVALYKEFNPFYEFIAGPMHAGSFGPTFMADPTFGPMLQFQYAGRLLGYDANAPPLIGHVLGYLEVSEEGVLDAQLLDSDGRILYRKFLTPEE